MLAFYCKFLRSTKGVSKQTKQYVKLNSFYLSKEQKKKVKFNIVNETLEISLDNVFDFIYGKVIAPLAKELKIPLNQFKD